MGPRTTSVRSRRWPSLSQTDSCGHSNLQERRENVGTAFMIRAYGPKSEGGQDRRRRRVVVVARLRWASLRTARRAPRPSRRPEDNFRLCGTISPPECLADYRTKSSYKIKAVAQIPEMVEVMRRKGLISWGREQTANTDGLLSHRASNSTYCYLDIENERMYRVSTRNRYELFSGFPAALDHTGSFPAGHLPHMMVGERGTGRGGTSLHSWT